jgi:hypothetical protein
MVAQAARGRGPGALARAAADGVGFAIDGESEGVQAGDGLALQGAGAGGLPGVETAPNWNWRTRSSSGASGSAKPTWELMETKNPPQADSFGDGLIRRPGIFTIWILHNRRARVLIGY